MSVLVVAGGAADRQALEAVGFEHVTISNLDEAEAGAGLAPYEWRYEDAESLTLDDESVRRRPRQRRAPPLPLAAPGAARALPRQPRRRDRDREPRQRPRAARREGRRGRRVRARGGRGPRARRGRRREHEHAELRLPLDGARGREDDRVVCATCTTPDPLLPRLRAARRARERGPRAARHRPAAAPADRGARHEGAAEPGQPVRVRDREAAAPARPPALAQARGRPARARRAGRSASATGSSGRPPRGGAPSPPT